MRIRVMRVERLCRKGKGHRYELIAGEVLFGLAASAMLLCAVFIPFEEDAMHVKYIFYGIFAVAAVFALVTAAAHIRFEMLPAFLLERADADFLRDNYNDTAIRLIDISEVAYKYNKDKYGNVIHGIDREGNYVPMSPEEAAGLTSMYLKASYLSYDKVTEEEFDARIVEVSGLDPDSREVQEVTVKVEFPGPFGSSGAGELFSDIRSAFAMSVKVKIKLCDFSGEGTEFRQDIDGKSFILPVPKRLLPHSLLPT